MNSDINLISNRSEKIEKERKALNSLRIIAGVCLFIVAAVSVGIFLINFTVPISAVKKQQEQTLSQISTLNKKFASYNLTKDRLKNISSLLTKRKNYGESLDKIYGKIPSNLAITEIRIEKGSLVMSVAGNSLLSINEVIESLINFSQNKEILSDLIIDSLLFDPKSGGYVVSFKSNIL